MTPDFSVTGLVVCYGQVKALSGVSLSLRAGEIVALIGNNGAGKTSLLRAVTGLVRPLAGLIRLGEQRLNNLSPDRIVSCGLSMVPEGRRVFQYMSVRDNLLMGAFHRRDTAAIKSDLAAIEERFPRLAERRRQLAGSLSGGEQQMVAIGRALMSRPRLLLLDEPSLGLAPMVVREIGRVVRAINRDDGVGVLLVEQNARMALSLAHRAYVIETGRVALEGPAAALKDNDHVRRIYLGG
jgi:branched-chain amino acid transport system ATP-binding protein